MRSVSCGINAFYYIEIGRDREMEELKNCPFCGGKAVFNTVGNSSAHHGVGFDFKIECEDCGVKLPKRYKVEFSLTDSGEINPLHDDRKRAVEEWNNRP